ncbi:hypothetical protein Q1695_006382 [Nippostrongylus brasiliensis]|nr:hypothetical protein Q1695_006382 [Nippostrongylus brasiliensis]
MHPCLIVERCRDVFKVFCHHNDYDLPVEACGELDDVGSWLLANIDGELLELLPPPGEEFLERLPPIRVVQDKAEVLTSGVLDHPYCQTKDFGEIPVLCHLPKYMIGAFIDVDVWARWLTPDERYEFNGAKWGVCEIVKIREQSVNQPSSRSTPEPSERICDRREPMSAREREESRSFVESSPSVIDSRDFRTSEDGRRPPQRDDYRIIRTRESETPQPSVSHTSVTGKSHVNGAFRRNEDQRQPSYRNEHRTAWPRESRSPQPPSQYSGDLERSYANDEFRMREEQRRPPYEVDRGTTWPRESEDPQRTAPFTSATGRSYAIPSNYRRSANAAGSSRNWEDAEISPPSHRPSGRECFDNSRRSNYRSDTAKGSSRNWEDLESIPPFHRPKQTDSFDGSYVFEKDRTIEILALVTYVQENNYNEAVADIWPCECSDGRPGILFTNNDVLSRSAIRPGRWIKCYISASYASEVFAAGSRNRPQLRISSAECKPVNVEYETTVSRNSVEVVVPVSVSAAHRIGDDFRHDELGLICDPQALLEGGRQYLLRISPNFRRKSEYRELIAPWRLVELAPVGENWGPHHTRKLQPERPLSNHNRPAPAPQRSEPVTIKTEVRQTSPNSEISSGDQQEKPSEEQNVAEGFPVVVAKPLSADELKVRRRVTAVAMVEEYCEEKQQYRVWLVEYHVDAKFTCSRILSPGHFFQGRFSIGGPHKNKCSSYIRRWEQLMDGFNVTTDAFKGVQLYVNGKHTNRKNRGCYEVYHEYLGYIRDTFNLLSRVDEATLVPITAQRRHCTAEGGELVWQIIALREQASE